MVAQHPSAPIYLLMVAQEEHRPTVAMVAPVAAVATVAMVAMLHMAVVAALAMVATAATAALMAAAVAVLLAELEVHMGAMAEPVPLEQKTEHCYLTQPQVQGCGLLFRALPEQLLAQVAAATVAMVAMATPEAALSAAVAAATAEMVEIQTHQAKILGVVAAAATAAMAAQEVAAQALTIVLVVVAAILLTVAPKALGDPQQADQAVLGMVMAVLAFA